MGNVIVVDLDGTLCDISHRVHHAQAREWDEFHSKLATDTCIFAVEKLLWALNEGDQYEFIALTGRPDKYRKATLDWLKNSGLRFMFDALLMRPDEDYRHDHEVKIALLEDHFGSKDIVLEEVWFVLDDRDSVVENLRNYGLTVFQTRQGDY